MKRTLTLLLALLMLLACTAALAEDVGFHKEGYPIVDEKVTLTALVGTSVDSPADLNDITILKEAEEATNVHIDWIGVTEGNAFDDRKGLMLATDDLPDIFYCCVSSSELAKYGAEGSFIPMEDLIAEYAPNLSAYLEARPELRKYVTAPDGHIYGVPKVSEGKWCATNQIYGINIDWLNKLGLEMPHTVSELKEVLIAFRDQDPNGNNLKDEIPFSFAVGDNFGIEKFEYIFSALGLPVDSKLIGIQDGKLYCVATDERFYEGIKTIHEWYEEGLIDPEAFIMNDSQWTAKLNAEETVIGVTPCWDISDSIVTSELRAKYDYMPALFGEDGSEPAMVVYNNYGFFRGAGVITKACEHPEVAMRYIDYWFEEMNSMQSMEGHVGERLFEGEDGALYLAGGGNVGEMDMPRNASCLASHGIWYIDADMYATKLRLPTTDLKVAHLEKNIIPYAAPEIWEDVFYTPEESEIVAAKQTDLKNLTNRMAGEWILNGVTDDDWAKFQNDLKELGVEEMLQTMQVAYDRTNAQ